MKLRNQLKREFGFYSFAWLPTTLQSGEVIWLKNYFIGGSTHGILNRYSVNHRRYEVKYEAIKR